MVRIPTEELERPKTEVSVEHMVAAAGVELKAAGKEEIHEKAHLTRTGSAVLDALEGEIPQLPAEPSSLPAT